MALKNLFAKLTGRSKKNKSGVETVERRDPAIGQGEGSVDNGTGDEQMEHSLVQKVETPEKSEAIEKLNEGFNRLVGELEGINQSLGRQVTQHEQIVSRMEDFARVIESMPAAIEEQKRVFTALLDDLREKESRFVELISKIPEEASRQTQTLSEIHEKVSHSSQADTKLVEEFQGFGKTLSKLDENAGSQARHIEEINRLFGENEAFYKTSIQKMNRRFLWLSLAMLGLALIAAGTVITAVLVSLNII